MFHHLLLLAKELESGMGIVMCMHCKWLRQRCRTDFILIAVEFWGSSKKYQCLSRLIKRCKPWQRKGRVKEVRALTPPGWNVDVIITCRATAQMITMANKRVPDHRLADSICIWPPCSLPCKSSHSRMQKAAGQYSTAKNTLHKLDWSLVELLIALGDFLVEFVGEFAH